MGARSRGGSAWDACTESIRTSTGSGTARSRSRVGSGAALLYAGLDCALSHTTAAWHWGLLTAEPTLIHLSGPGDRKSIRGVRIHHPRHLDAIRHNDLPVTTVPRTLLDLAATLPFADIRRALAEADFRGLLDLGALTATLGNGRAGKCRAARGSLLPPAGAGADSQCPRGTVPSALRVRRAAATAHQRDSRGVDGRRAVAATTRRRRARRVGGTRLACTHAGRPRA